MSKPTLVLVHGSWHCPQHWDPLIKVLEEQGYKCATVGLPSTQSPDLPPANLTDDTTAVRKAVLVELERNNVVVVAHSFGGCPTNNALEDLDHASRTRDGASTAVLAIAFIASIPLPQGLSFLQILGGKPGAIHDLRTEDFAWVGSPGPEHYFYNDMPPEEVKQAVDLLRPQSWLAYKEATTYAAYMDIPSAYLYCTRDQAFVPEGQKGLIGAAKEAGAKFFHEETFDVSHSPFLSKTKETADYVRRVAGEEI